MAEPLVLQLTRRFKASLASGEQEAVKAMTRQWMRLQDQLEANVEAVALELRDADREGRKPDPRMVWENQRYQSLLAQLNNEMARVVPDAERQIQDVQREAIDLGLQHAQQSIAASYFGAGKIAPTFNMLPKEALQNMVGFVADGTPLGSLLRTAYGTAGPAIGDLLVTGTALGWNPRKVTSKALEAGAAGLGNMLTIARTEQMRAYREADRAQMAASGVVEYYVRLVTHSARTCMACLAAEGEKYELREELRDHPNGRCVAVAKCEGVPLPSFESGESWFAKQAPDVQQRMMGAGKYAAWKEGKFEFDQLAVRTINPTWGDGVRPATLAELTGRVSKAGKAAAPAPKPTRPISENEADLESGVREAQAAYRKALESGNAAEAEAIREYYDMAAKEYEDDRQINESLWERFGLSPDKASDDDWRKLAAQFDNDAQRLYRKYTKDGVKLEVDTRRGAKDAGFANVGGNVVAVKKGQFSVREAQRLQGELWADAKQDLTQKMGDYLKQLGYKESDIAKANYEQRQKLLAELAQKRVSTTRRGAVSVIDDVPPEARQTVTSRIDYDAAARCGSVAQDPLNLPTLDAYRRMEMAQKIRDSKLSEDSDDDGWVDSSLAEELAQW